MKVYELPLDYARMNGADLLCMEWDGSIHLMERSPTKIGDSQTYFSLCQLARLSHNTTFPTVISVSEAVESDKMCEYCLDH